MRLLRFAAALLPALLFAQPDHGPSVHKLLVICIDGLDERFLNQPSSRVKIPNIRRLMSQGAVSSGVIGVAPSQTWPSEISLITGVPPSEHGVLPDGKAVVLKATSLLRAAAKQGLKTAAVDWPAVAAEDAAFYFPERSATRQGSTLHFDEVARLSTPSGIIDRIEKASPGFEKTLWDDTSSARAAIYLLETEKPDVVVVQLADVETEQTETGALSIYARDALDSDDELVGQMIAKAQPGTVTVLVSGHGFENQNYIVRPKVLLRQGRQAASTVPVEVEDGLIGTRDRVTADRLRKLMRDGHRHGIAREVPMPEVRAKAPSLGRWVAAFDTPPDYVASGDVQGPALGPGSHLGVTGQWPTRPGYRSVFVISGEGIAARKLGEIDLLQVAPTLADALGTRLPRASAASLWHTITH